MLQDDDNTAFLRAGPKPGRRKRPVMPRFGQGGLAYIQVQVAQGLIKLRPRRANRKLPVLLDCRIEIALRAEPFGHVIVDQPITGISPVGALIMRPGGIIPASAQCHQSPLQFDPGIGAHVLCRNQIFSLRIQPIGSVKVSLLPAQISQARKEIPLRLSLDQLTIGCLGLPITPFLHIDIGLQHLVFRILAKKNQLLQSRLRLGQPVPFQIKRSLQQIKKPD